MKGGLRRVCATVIAAAAPQERPGSPAVCALTARREERGPAGRQPPRSSGVGPAPPGAPEAQLVNNPSECRRPWFDSWVGKIPWKRERLPTPVFWFREFHGLYSPWGCKELDTTERLSLSLTPGSTLTPYPPLHVRVGQTTQVGWLSHLGPT